MKTVSQIVKMFMTKQTALSGDPIAGSILNCRSDWQVGTGRSLQSILTGIMGGDRGKGIFFPEPVLSLLAWFPQIMQEEVALTQLKVFVRMMDSLFDIKPLTGLDMKPLLYYGNRDMPIYCARLKTEMGNVIRFDTVQFWLLLRACPMIGPSTFIKKGAMGGLWNMGPSIGTQTFDKNLGADVYISLGTSDGIAFSSEYLDSLKKNHLKAWATRSNMWIVTRGSAGSVSRRAKLSGTWVATKANPSDTIGHRPIVFCPRP